MTELKRIVLDLRSDELVLRCLYSTQDGPGPNTKARRRQVEDLVRTGLQDALEVLDGDVKVVGTSGFTTREDVLCIAARETVPSSVHKKGA